MNPKHGGELPPAWRESLQGGRLDCAGTYRADPAHKSSVPYTIRRQVQPEGRRLVPYFQRPKYARLPGAHNIVDHPTYAAGDWFSSDDFTLEIHWSADGETLTCGQFLPLIDCRSKKILDFLLIPEKRYTRRHIRSLFNLSSRRAYGLPGRGWHVERGIWAESQMVGGAVPGWLGPNDQVVKLEAVRAAKLVVASGRQTPAAAGFLAYEQFLAVLGGEARPLQQHPAARPRHEWHRDQGNHVAG